MHFGLALLFFFTLLLGGCSDPEPIKIGFIGGLSGRVADLGLAGRNGATLAVEECNRSGGIDQRQVELLLADDKQNPQVARNQVQQLIDQEVVSIIGPMTSSMAAATVDLANAHKVPMLSPTVTTENLTGIDDYFLRIVSGTDQYSAAVATHLYQQKKINNVSVIYDLRNKSYTESWFRGFKREFETLGGRLLRVSTFHSSPEVRFSQLADTLLAESPTGIISIASSMDTAMLSQQLRKKGYQHLIAAPSWSATEKLIEMGGKAVEGMLVSQFFDRDSQAPDYLQFKASYQERFIEEPGFVSVAAYDATKMLLQALKSFDRQPIKQQIINLETFYGVQGEINIDRFGDAQRPIVLSIVQDGKFHVVE